MADLVNQDQEQDDEPAAKDTLFETADKMQERTREIMNASATVNATKAPIEIKIPSPTNVSAVLSP